MAGFGYDTINLRQEEAVLIAQIAAPPMNLLGPELVRDLVSLIQRAEADDAVQVLVFQSADPRFRSLPRVCAQLRGPKPDSDRDEARIPDPGRGNGPGPDGGRPGG
jgi:hypothetical protein